jgi:hypothetical protein
MTTDALKGAVDARGQGLGLVRWLAGLNLGLAALQPVSAGFFLSGYEYAAAMHAVVAHGLLLGVLLQAVTALVLWRRRRVPAWVAGQGIGLFVMVFVEVGLGHKMQFWLHVPLGVAVVGWLTRQVSRLDALWRTTAA